MMTDIHFGRRGNSRVHNQDCLDHIEWFCAKVKSEGADCVGFLGDWFESRSAINIETLDYSYRGLKMLDDLGLPVYFIVGNHDLHRRTTRDVHSVRIFNELKNFTVVDRPTVIDGMLFSPFLFDHEYADLLQYNNLQAWFGHFEFMGFAITGYNTILEHGPNHKLFNGPKKIFSGHFHKRQQIDNVVYIGNAFPMDMGDSADYDRGCAIYEVAADRVTFHNWADAPTYLKVPLTFVIAEKWRPRPKMKVKCMIDGETLSYTELNDLREALIETYDLRDFIFEEDREALAAVVAGTDEQVEDVAALKFDSVDELVTLQLKAAMEEKAFKNKYDVDLLVQLYGDAKVDSLERDE